MTHYFICRLKRRKPCFAHFVIFRNLLSIFQKQVHIVEHLYNEKGVRQVFVLHFLNLILKLEKKTLIKKLIVWVNKHYPQYTMSKDIKRKTTNLS